MNNWQAFATKVATTTHLALSNRDRLRLWWLQHERHVRDALWGAVMVVFALLIHSLLRPVEAPLQPIVQQPGAAMLIATPTAGPVVPTATPAPTAEPVIVVQQVEVPVYVPVEQPVYVDTYTPPTLPPYEPQPATEEKPADERAANYAEATSGHGSKPRDTGGSGKMPAPDVSFDSNAEWCAASGQARCVEGP